MSFEPNDNVVGERVSSTSVPVPLRPIVMSAALELTVTVADMVATLERARGRGLATALMRQALLEARERGMETTSLQATRMGAPIYARLGYRDLGAIQMWERRR